MKKQIMIALMLVTSLAAMEGTIVSTATPRITSDLSGIELVSWVYAIYMLATAVSTPIYGKLADLLGRKRVLLVGIVIFLIGSMLCGMAMNMTQLIVFRAIQGLGAGAVMPITMTIIGDLNKEAQARVKAQGWISAVWGVSGVIGPLLGGFLVDTLSWRYIFFLNVPFGLLSLFMIVKYYKEQILKEKRHIDYPGAVTFSLGVIALLYALLTGSQTQQWTDNLLIGLFSSSFVLFILFIWIQKQSPEPLVPLNLFSNSTITTVNFLTLFMGGILISITVYLPLFTQGILGKSATAAGFMLMPMPVCWTIGSIFSGQLVSKLKPTYVITLGTIFLLIAASSLFSLTQEASDWFIYASIGILGLGMGIITPVLMLIIQGSVPQHKRGTAISLNTFTNTFSQTLGAAVFGTLFNLQVNANGGDSSMINSSFEHQKIAPSSLASIQEHLFSGIHTVFTCIMILAFLSVIIGFVLIKKVGQKELSQS
ncbi:MDR family MFS transporter [Bacillus sp. CBEL-1]|uniref:MDR family MFS transporter n=1 Tax=Bacillus sp. CBEL-1 TaxID=2502980 RepID=UPI0010498EEA|nr:MDR family MFS transporter [Bacillus sp. CBEL-1]TDB50188.1 MFS transporter [Bacillus sp. CBEL-1]USY53860.1 MFS transporter [Bacillus sp. 1780r2a1]